MPDGDVWAEARVALIATLYARIVDPAALGPRLLAKLKPRDLARLRHRLGILTLWDPRRPEGPYRLTLSNADERLVAKTLFSISTGTNGGWVDAVFRPSETFAAADDWSSLYDLPSGASRGGEPKRGRVGRRGGFVSPRCAPREIHVVAAASTRPRPPR